ncbi:MAG: glycosyl hydrolase family 32, partial [Selenomonas sp.]|nr:glycosyl hydrolase family 32 [Selenomonas sp.]
MKKQILAALLAASTLCVSSSDVSAHQALFPNTGYSWVGDTMPYYDGQQFRIFYLEDMRDGDTGFHPWSLWTTKDFTDFHHDSWVIPYDQTNEFA